MSTETLQLSDIPDLSDMAESEPDPFVNGWYAATIQERREFTDQNGNDRVFESNDTPSANGDSRNIKLQVAITRADGRSMNLSSLTNYQPETLTAERVQAVAAQKEKVNAKTDEWGPLFRDFMTLTRLSALQKIAGVRQLARNGNGGLELHSLFNKKCYVRLVDDDRNPLYKMIKEFRADAPRKAKVL